MGEGPTGPVTGAVGGTAASRVQAERILSLGFVVIRSVSLVQAFLAIAFRALPAIGEHWLPFACLSVFLLESTVVIVTVLHRNLTALPPALILLDGTVGIVSLAVAVTSAPGTERLTPWSVGLHMAAVSAGALVGLARRSLGSTLLLSSVFATLYLVAVAVPAWPHQVSVAAAISNSLMYPGFAVSLAVFGRLVRDLADEADRSIARIAALEREHGRETVREVLPLLSPEILTDAEGPARSRVVDQLRTAYHRMRFFVDGVSPRGPQPTSPTRSGREPFDAVETVAVAPGACPVPTTDPIPRITP